MATHIIWHNPCPPPKIGFKLRRVAGNPSATVYQVASPNYRYPFELVRTAIVRAARTAKNKAVPSTPASAAGLVLARW
jgi:hypothetical protein